MAKENITPEDKLLKIIEDPSLAGKEKRFSPLGEKLNYAREVKERVLSLWPDGQIFEFFSLRTLNKFLMGICVVGVIFLIFYFNYRRAKSADRLLDIEIGRNGFKLGAPPQDFLTLGLEDALSVAKKRNIFSFVPPADEEDKYDEEDVGSLTEQLADIKVVGIIWSETNPEVMLEKVSEDKTFLLREGEAAGPVKVKKIYRTKVIVEMGGKEWDLQ